jgi:hypothetical protein
LTVKPGDDDWNQKGGRKARRLIKTVSDNAGVPGRSEAPPGLEGYFLDFFFDFDFFAFFAFFAFLAIVSSQGLMDGNATRGMLGGGPASQHPRIRSQQIRGALPRTVTPVSSRYPQLLCVLTRFLPREPLRAANSSHATSDLAASAGLTTHQRCGAFCIYPERLHHFNTTARITPPR